MKRAFALMLFAGALAYLGTAGSSAADRDTARGEVLEFDGLKSAVPGTWKQEEPSNRMRFAQFRLPAAKGDKTGGEVVIFKGLGGSARANVARWKGMFIPPKGEKEDFAKVEEMKIGGHPATYLDVHGTYLFKARPFDPQAKPERRPDYRMLAVHFEGPKNIYHIRLVGPAKTVAQYKKGFDEWLKAFK